MTEPMGEKLVTELAGIGEVLGKRLTEANYDKVALFFKAFCFFRGIDFFLIQY